MATLPGQRILLLVSNGFPPIEQEARFPESQVIDLAEQSNVIVDVIDARGLYIASIAAGDDIQGKNPAQVADYRRSSMKITEDSMGELAAAPAVGSFTIAMTWMQDSKLSQSSQKSFIQSSSLSMA